MWTLRYPLTLTPDTNATLLVRFKDVPEAISFGNNEKEALAMARDALETGLSFYVDAHKALPVAGKAQPGQKTVRPSLWGCVKLSLYQFLYLPLYQRISGVKKPPLKEAVYLAG